MEKQDVKRMQIVRHLKQQNTATRTTKKRSTTYNTPVRHDSENYQQREIENNSELFPKERPEFSDLDSTSKLSLQQERTNEKYIEPEHPEFYRRIEETSPLEDQLGLVYTDQPQAEPKISYHERDIHNLRLFTQRYILQKEIENFANQAQVQVTSGNVERPQTTGELAGIYENEMRESPSTSQVSRQIETSEMLFSEYTEPAMPDILKRDSFSMQESYHRNTEDNFAQDNGSNATVWSVSAPKEKIFSPEVSLMHEEQVPAYIPEHKTAEEQISLQEQRMKNLRLFAQKYAKQKATNQIPSVYLEHQESNSLQMGTPFNINSGVQENFPSREQQEQRAAEDQAEQQRQEILRQNDIYQQTIHRRSEEELFPESERSSVYSDLAFGEKQNPTLSARKYANAVIGNTISVSANATSTEQILSSDTTSKQDTVMPLTSSEIDGILESSDALKGCVLSFGNRDGKYVQSLTRYFDGTTASSTDKEIIERAYDAMIARRPSISRWSYEKADCLAQLAGTLDIYAPSENGAGGIDWSWKKSNQTSASGNAAVQAALNAVGSGYSQTRRDDPGWYDCSSLVYRSYAAAGITYLNGKCAAEQAQYLVSHNMTVSYSELQPGDLIFYSYEVNGRYRNISHVAIYVGDGVMVHAANESRGVVKQALSQSNLSPQLYCRPQ